MQLSEHPIDLKNDSDSSSNAGRVVVIEVTLLKSFHSVALEANLLCVPG